MGLKGGGWMLAKMRMPAATVFESQFPHIPDTPAAHNHKKTMQFFENEPAFFVNMLKYYLF